MSEDYIRVLEAAGLTDAARIIEAMGERKPEPAPEPAEADSAPPARQYATQAEADGAAMMDALRASGILNKWSSAGSVLDQGNDR